MSLLDFFKKSPPKKVPLRFHNTLSGELESFTPLNGGPVKMYNCGPTVYDFQHIGNLKAYIFADTIKRSLALWGHKTKQVINITDVGHLVSDNDDGEDKMEVGAKKRGQTVEEVVQEVTAAFFEDLDALNINRETISFPRATEYIGEQIALVQSLEEKGYTYQIEDGVYFDTSKFKEYGKLGNIDIHGQEEGARIGVVAGKRNLSDFALWKFSPKDEKREQEWNSPWGIGFPGWHLECTAMIFKLLGRQIDIHTGGIDHIPVHHNNEIAQAEAATQKQYVKYWMHGAFITIEGKKISKSLGNTIYLHSIIERGFSPLAFRYLLLTAHYRTQLNFTWTALEGAAQALTRLYRIIHEDLPKTGNASEAFTKKFDEVIAEDLNTPAAIALVWEMLKDPKVTPNEKRGNLLYADRIFGLDLGGKKRHAGMKSISVIPFTELPESIREQVAARETARKERNFAEADTLRDEVKKAGYEIKDTDEGPTVIKI